VIDAPNIALAFAAGLVSFMSPCCLPLVPGYLATVSGLEPAALGRRVDPGVVGRSAVFVGTFSLLFILLGLGATAIGSFLFDNQPTLNKVAGVAIVAMGLLFVASVFVVRLNRDFRPQTLMERAGRGGPVVAGAAFAIAWTPCVGPTLGAILGLASTQQGTGQGALLLAAYSAGLALPSCSPHSHSTRLRGRSVSSGAITRRCRWGPAWCSSSWACLSSPGSCSA
jgi:cytochrome c-type biogenesis protein